jgi:4,5-DOPA dioxygenase extradiol
MQLIEALQVEGWPVRIHPDRGLDHGAWVPLRYMYPEADIPVVNVSIDEHKGPDYHYRLGQVLASALDDDVLLMASGSLTHNLGDFRQPHYSTPAYVTDFQQWIQARLKDDDVQSLLEYRQQAPGGKKAHPSDEHLLPLFVALGAAGARHRASIYFDEVMHQILAMDIYCFERLE